MISILKIDESLRRNNGYLQDQDGYYMEFVADTAADVNDLPTGKEIDTRKKIPRPGSMAVCIAERSLYILSNKRKWTLFWEGQ